MKVSFSNVNQNYSLNLNKIKNSNSSTNVSFKGNDNNAQAPSSEYFSAQLHPAFALQVQLLNDGYTIEEIKKSEIFSHIDFSKPNFRASKNLEDVYALKKGYSLLKEKFDSPDVQKHVSEMAKLEEEVASILAGLGHEKLPMKTSAKKMILFTLHYVDRNNVDLLEELLNDENFDNTQIHHALMKLDKNKPSTYALEALKMAQEYGYDKEFSFALSVIISEADETNMPIIEKMLSEQEFLSENSKFVSEKLMSFLRYSHPEITIEYLTNENVTLEDVDEMFDNLPREVIEEDWSDCEDDFQDEEDEEN